MRTSTLWLLALVLVALPAAAQKVYVDFDRNFDFSTVESFAWANTEEVSLADTSPLMHSRVKNAIEYQMTTAGMREDIENPDLFITYYSEEKQEVVVNTDTFGYGYGAGWGWDPYWGSGWGSATTTARTYTDGTLVIDAWDAKNKKLVWRGTATAVVKTNPEKAAKQIDKAVEKIVNTWRKTRSKELGY